jgi:SpoVK/Ycf46/Vps4 family AAA+-type ATPase
MKTDPFQGLSSSRKISLKRFNSSFESIANSIRRISSRILGTNNEEEAGNFLGYVGIALVFYGFYNALHAKNRDQFLFKFVQSNLPAFTIPSQRVEWETFNTIGLKEILWDESCLELTKFTETISTGQDPANKSILASSSVTNANTLKTPLCETSVDGVQTKQGFGKKLAIKPTLPSVLNNPPLKSIDINGDSLQIRFHSPWEKIKKQEFVGFFPISKHTIGPSFAYAENSKRVQSSNELTLEKKDWSFVAARKLVPWKNPSPAVKENSCSSWISYVPSSQSSERISAYFQNIKEDLVVSSPWVKTDSYPIRETRNEGKGDTFINSAEKEKTNFLGYNNVFWFLDDIPLKLDAFEDHKNALSTTLDESKTAEPGESIEEENSEKISNLLSLDNASEASQEVFALLSARLHGISKSQKSILFSQFDDQKNMLLHSSSLGSSTSSLGFVSQSWSSNPLVGILSVSLQNRIMPPPLQHDESFERSRKDTNETELIEPSAEEIIDINENKDLSSENDSSKTGGILFDSKNTEIENGVPLRWPKGQRVYLFQGRQGAHRLRVIAEQGLPATSKARRNLETVPGPQTNEGVPTLALDMEPLEANGNEKPNQFDLLAGLKAKVSTPEGGSKGELPHLSPKGVRPYPNSLRVRTWYQGENPLESLTYQGYKRLSNPLIFQGARSMSGFLWPDMTRDEIWCAYKSFVRHDLLNFVNPSFGTIVERFLLQDVFISFPASFTIPPLERKDSLNSQTEAVHIHYKRSQFPGIRYIKTLLHRYGFPANTENIALLAKRLDLAEKKELQTPSYWSWKGWVSLFKKGIAFALRQRAREKLIYFGPSVARKGQHPSLIVRDSNVPQWVQSFKEVLGKEQDSFFGEAKVVAGEITIERADPEHPVELLAFLDGELLPFGNFDKNSLVKRFEAPVQPIEIRFDEPSVTNSVPLLAVKQRSKVPELTPYEWYNLLRFQMESGLESRNRLQDIRFHLPKIVVAHLKKPNFSAPLTLFKYQGFSDTGNLHGLKDLYKYEDNNSLPLLHLERLGLPSALAAPSLPQSQGNVLVGKNSFALGSVFKPVPVFVEYRSHVFPWTVSPFNLLTENVCFSYGTYQHLPTQFDCKRSWFHSSKTLLNLSSETFPLEEPFQENWEPITLSSWMIVYKMFYILWIQESLKVLYRRYGKEILKNLVSIFAALGFDMSEIIEFLELNETDSGLRVIEKKRRGFLDIAGIDDMLPELSEFVWSLRTRGTLPLFKRARPNVQHPFLFFPFKRLVGSPHPSPEIWKKKVGHKQLASQSKSRKIGLAPTLSISSKGTLLVGPPGTGKTFLVQAIAGEAQVPVVIQAASALMDLDQKQSPSQLLKKLFDKARELSPCILFIDEIDTLGRSRENVLLDSALTEMGTDPSMDSFPALGINLFKTQGASPENENDGSTVHESSATSPRKDGNPLGDRDEATGLSKKMLNESAGEMTASEVLQSHEKKNQISKQQLAVLMQFLVEMDGLKPLSGVLLIGATNRPNVLDPAFVRPGRFEKTIRLEIPNKQKRIEILKHYSKKLGAESNLKWNYLATMTTGFTAADLASAMNQSSLEAICNNAKSLPKHTLETLENGIEAISRERGSTTLSSLESKILKKVIPLISLEVKPNPIGLVQGGHPTMLLPPLGDSLGLTSQEVRGGSKANPSQRGSWKGESKNVLLDRLNIRPSKLKKLPVKDPFFVTRFAFYQSGKAVLQQVLPVKSKIPVFSLSDMPMKAGKETKLISKSSFDITTQRSDWEYQLVHTYAGKSGELMALGTGSRNFTTPENLSLNSPREDSSTLVSNLRKWNELFSQSPPAATPSLRSDSASLESLVEMKGFPVYGSRSKAKIGVEPLLLRRKERLTPSLTGGSQATRVKQSRTTKVVRSNRLGTSWVTKNAHRSKLVSPCAIDFYPIGVTSKGYSWPYPDPLVGLTLTPKGDIKGYGWPSNTRRGYIGDNPSVQCLAKEQKGWKQTFVQTRQTSKDIWASSLGMEDLENSILLIQLLITDWYLYSRKVCSTASAVLQLNRNREQTPDLFAFDSLKFLALKQKDEITKQSLTDREQEFLIPSWWQLQVANYYDSGDLAFSEWYRIFLADPEESDRNEEWISPDDYFNSSELLQDMSTGEDLNLILCNEPKPLKHSNLRSQLSQNISLLTEVFLPSGNSLEAGEPPKGEDGHPLVGLPVGLRAKGQPPRRLYPLKGVQVAIEPQGFTKRKKTNQAKEKPNSLITCNDFPMLIKDYIAFGIVSNGFNTAFACLHESREMLDLFADSMVRFDRIRDPDLSKIYLRFCSKGLLKVRK